MYTYKIKPSPQKDSVAPPAKYAAMIIYEPKPKIDSKGH
jgi:hypothetical protein